LKQSPRTRTVDALAAVPSTLLIPLAARARGATQFAQFDPHDRHAEAVLDASGAKVDAFLSDRVTVLNVLWRTALIKEMGVQFFERHPSSPGVNLGAGLSSYFQWFDNGSNSWLDADLPEVITLRKRYLQPLPQRCHNRNLNIMQAGWWKDLHCHKGKDAPPVLLICEGVLLYLAPAVVDAVLKEVGDNAPAGSEFICDFVSPLWIDQAALHPSVASTGAQFRSGAHDAEELAKSHPRLRVLEQHSACEAYGLAAQMVEMLWRPYTGGAMYGLTRLGVR